MSDETPQTTPPILAEKHYAAPSVFDVSNLMREARRTNTMATAGDDFEKGPDQGSQATLAIIGETARIWRAANCREKGG